MKFNLIVRQRGAPPGAEWVESYDDPEILNKPQAEAWALNVIEAFNLEEQSKPTELQMPQRDLIEVDWLDIPSDPVLDEGQELSEYYDDEEDINDEEDQEAE